MRLRTKVAATFLLLGAVLATPALAAKKPKVLFIGMDGFRGDVYGNVATPNLDSLIANGYLSREGWTADTAISGTGWSSLFTGVERDKHGVYDNSFNGKRYVDYPDVLTRIERAAPALGTAVVVSWSPLTTQIPWQADVVHGTNGNDADVRTRAVQLLSSATLDVLLVGFDNPDAAGHAGTYFNRDSSGYTAAIRTVDGYVGELTAALRARPGYADEDWLIILGTDHGGSAHHGHNTPEDRRTLIGFSGAGVPKLGVDGLRLAPRQVDVAPSILAHMGLPLPADLDGRPMQRPPADAAALGRNLLANGDAEYSVGRRDRSYDSDVPGWRKGRGGQVVSYGQHSWLPTPSAGAGRNLFIGRDAGRSNSLVQRVDLRALGAGGAAFRLSADLGASSGHRARVLLRFYDAQGFASCADGNTGHVFRGGNYWRYDIAADRVAAGYPQAITFAWPGLDRFAGGAADIDAVLNAGNGKLYFFKGDQYLRFDRAAGRADAGYPLPIAGRWPGLEKFAGGARDLDAVLSFSRSQTYFFKGDEYIRYNLDLDRADTYYPAYLSESTWPNTGYWPSHWRGALNFPNGKSYLFKPGEYLRYDRIADRGDAGYPATVTAANWPGLENLFQNAAFELAPGAGSGALQRYLRNGSVPLGAQWAEVEIRFEHGSGSGDAFADNVGLVIER